MRTLAIALLGLGAGCLTPTATFAATSNAKQCNLKVELQIPITMHGLTPVTDAKLDGKDVPLIVDSGAFFSMLSPAVAAELKLPLRMAPFGLTVSGVVGSADVPQVTDVTLTLAQTTFQHKFEFLVGGNDVSGFGRGLLAQDNLLGIADVEYDLANGVIRLIKPEGNCDYLQFLYWAKDSTPFSMLEINKTTLLEPHTVATAMVNGSKIKVIFDTGAGSSYLSLHSAERVGVKPDSPGVTPGGLTHGLGRGTVNTWIAPFESFRLGSEEIRNTRLRIGELTFKVGDMLIGADFFLSHRIYVANSQHKLYFTYNGGPVFNLTTAAPTQTATASDTNVPDDALLGSEPKTSEEFFRRGTAFLSRRDYTHALPDLQRACELGPQEPKYFFERARLYSQAGQLALADADLDTTLKLQPDNVDALFWRAMRKLSRKDNTGAIADLDAVDHAAASQANIRLELGRAYQKAEQFPEALKQYDLWAGAHNDDEGLATVFSGRCLVRALIDQSLGPTLYDCNRALSGRTENPDALSGRALVYLRLGKFDRAIPDFSAVLKQQPQNARALLGRALAERELKKTPDAQTDYAAATALDPNIVEDFRKRGILP